MEHLQQKGYSLEDHLGHFAVGGQDLSLDTSHSGIGTNVQERDSTDGYRTDMSECGSESKSTGPSTPTQLSTPPQSKDDGKPHGIPNLKREFEETDATEVLGRTAPSTQDDEERNTKRVKTEHATYIELPISRDGNVSITKSVLDGLNNNQDQFLRHATFAHHPNLSLQFDTWGTFLEFAGGAYVNEDNKDEVKAFEALKDNLQFLNVNETWNETTCGPVNNNEVNEELVRFTGLVDLSVPLSKKHHSGGMGKERRTPENTKKELSALWEHGNVPTIIVYTDDYDIYKVSHLPCSKFSLTLVYLCKAHRMLTLCRVTKLPEMPHISYMRSLLSPRNE